MPKILKDGKILVRVSWIDSYSRDTGNWIDIDELEEQPELAVCESVGWLFHDTDKLITLVAHYAGDQIGGDITISKDAIVSIIELREGFELSAKGT